MVAFEPTVKFSVVFVTVAGEHRITWYKAGYPLDYSKGGAEAGKALVQEMFDVAADKVKNLTESAEAIF